MNLLRSVLAGVCVAVAASGVQARSWADIEKSGTLIAATGGDLKPFNYFEGKQLTGFEVELTDAIAKLEKILHSDEVKQYIEKTWSDGSVIPAF